MSQPQQINMEVRRLSAAPAEFRLERVERADGGVDTYVKGYAVVFEQYSKPFYDEWVEIISRNAFDNADLSDVVMVVDHSRNVSDVLARLQNGEGTLSITIDERGVAFRFLVPDTTVGRDIVTLIERGDISQCSFAFWVGAEKWSFDQIIDSKKYDVRRIEEVVKLSDLSIVVNGQYPQTSVEVDEATRAEARRMAGKDIERATGMHTTLADKILTTLTI